MWSRDRIGYLGGRQIGECPSSKAVSPSLFRTCRSSSRSRIALRNDEVSPFLAIIADAPDGGMIRSTTGDVRRQKFDGFLISRPTSRGDSSMSFFESVPDVPAESAKIFTV